MAEKTRFSISGIIRAALLMAAILGLWSFFRSYLFLILLALWICGIAASFFLWRKGREQFAYTVLFPGQRVGKQLDFEAGVLLENGHPFAGFVVDTVYRFRNVFTGYEETVKEHTFIAPKAQCRLGRYMCSRYAGRVELWVEKICLYDLFHIFYAEISDQKNGHVTVWPAFFQAEEETPLSELVEGFPEEALSRKKGVDYQPDYEVREYIPGDELKTIHWKLSAKQGRTMVRERLASGREKMNVVLPFRPGAGENDRLMDSMYGLCRLFLAKGYPLQIFWPGNGHLESFYAAEEGELDAAVVEILDNPGSNTACDVRARMELEHPGENYVLIQIGAYKGAYIQEEGR